MTGASRIRRIASAGLGLLGALALVAALLSLASLAPLLLGAEGSHMAGDAKLGLIIATFPLTLVALVLLGLAWRIERPRSGIRRALIGGLLVSVGVLLGGTVGWMLPVPEPTAAIPADAQRVHVSVTDGTIVVEPSTVRAGSIWVLFDASASNVAFVGKGEEPQGARPTGPGPLSDAEIAALAGGDRYRTYSISGMGEVTNFVLAPGKYAFELPDPAQMTAPQPLPALSLGVLEVVAGP